MTSTHRSRTVLVVTLLLLVLPVVAPSTGTAATWVWPSFNCIQTLQQCINWAAHGDIVEIASQGPIQESLQIEGKSLILRPYSGTFPVFGAQTIVVFGGSGAPGGTVQVTIQGLTFKSTRLILRQTGTDVFDVRVVDNTILDTSTSGNAILVSSTNYLPLYGPVFFEVSRNRIHLRGTSASSYLGAIAVGDFLSTARGKIVGNTILQTGIAVQGEVIEVYGAERSTTVDVIDNEIRGVFNAGIVLHQGGTGKLAARTINNLVVGQDSIGGATGGIVVYGARGSTLALVVNNTVAGGHRGIEIYGGVDPGATLGGTLANNVVVGHRHSGITIDPTFQATFVNDHNLAFRNVSESFTPGAGTLFVDPLFATANDFRLSSSSPARDAGLNARVPADITLDLARLPRIQGVAVAMGAYER